jgi:glutathione S-transferase
MSLYYLPNSCALAAHIVAEEAGIPIAAVRIDFATKTVVATGADYLAINPKGYVPTLELDDGEILTEGSLRARLRLEQRHEPSQCR